MRCLQLLHRAAKTRKHTALNLTCILTQAHNNNNNSKLNVFSFFPTHVFYFKCQSQRPQRNAFFSVGWVTPADQSPRTCSVMNVTDQALLVTSRHAFSSPAVAVVALWPPPSGGALTGGRAERPAAWMCRCLTSRSLTLPLRAVPLQWFEALGQTDVLFIQMFTQNTFPHGITLGKQKGFLSDSIRMCCLVTMGYVLM